jgi:hypothetical protein
MLRRVIGRTSARGWWILVAFCSVAVAQTRRPHPDPDTPPIVGRWDATVQGTDGKYPSWLEFSRSGNRALVGRYVGQFGSARPISTVEHADGSFRFTVPPQWEDRRTDVVVEGRLEGDVIRGETTNDSGVRIRWEGKRAPLLDRRESNSRGEPIELFNGRDLTGWRPRNAKEKNGWQVRDGVLVNADPVNDLVSDRQFTDFEIRAEFRYPRGSNSGVYLRGRYEVQIEDNFGQEPDSHRIGGVYGFLMPCVNAAREAGQWQTLEVTLIGRRVTIVLNGERVVDRQLIPGITGGALDSDEGQPGPILIQGDHGAIEFRSVRIIPIATNP